MNNKIIEIKNTNNNENKNINRVNSSEKKDQEVKNMDIRAIKNSNILIDGEKKQKDNLNREINKRIINMEKAIVNDINKIISPMADNINKIKDMFYYLIFILICHLVLIIGIFIIIIFFKK